MEMPIWLVYVLVVLAIAGFASMVGWIILYIGARFEANQSLENLDIGQDDELELLRDIRDAVKSIENRKS